MRTRAAVTSIMASMGILAIGWNIGAQAFPELGSTTTSETASGATAQSSTATSGSSSASGSTDTNATSTVADGSYTGNDVNTRFGSVQVAVTIANGSITEVTALQLTDDGNRSRQISNYAAPILAEEIVSSQSTSVSNVSGATYTTDAYLTSVQSALDQAGF